LSPTNTTNQRNLIGEQSTGIISTNYSRNHKESLLNRRQSSTSIASNIPNKKPRISTEHLDTQIDTGDSSSPSSSSDFKINSKSTVKGKLIIIKFFFF
jgi:hypothetical protein